ncbi:dienelactone hydrolase family-domain-containing protein [Mycena rebaudengoi]|nr:dienelactone hydrolase family-domain-containing protein [Mycena rebaudengoi]
MQGLPEKAGVKLTFFDTIKLVFVMLPSLFALIRNRPSVAARRTVSTLTKIQALKKYEKLGAIGYCFGGGIAIRLGASTEFFSSIVLVHPSPAPTDAQMKAIKAPTAWSCSEDDMFLTPAKLDHIEAFYVERKGKENYVDYELKVYKGTAHGFGARPNLTYPEVKEGYEKAFQQAVDWFNKTIPA